MSLLRSTFIALSTNSALRQFSESSQTGRKMSSRFVAGLSLEDVLLAAKSVNAQHMSATLDSLGENVHTAEAAEHSAQIYHDLLDAIGTEKLDANVSVKLTQMGMDVDPQLTQSVVSRLVEHARHVGSFVRIDMEGSSYTGPTLDLVRNLHGAPENRGRIGVVIQAYLFRSETDVRDLVSQGIRIRLCKGAYKEPPNVAFPAKADVDRNFVKLMKMLLGSGIFHGIATHDEAMIEATKQHAADQKIDPASFEFQMLYGIRRDLQKQLVEEGFRVRVYIPFGTEWYPYFMRRLAERPANVLFLARNFLRN